MVIDIGSDAMTKSIGLLVMAYGTPRSHEEIEGYYTHIRRGRKPSVEQLEELKARYEMIGGLSPLAAITEKQVQALEAALNEQHDELQFKAYIGLKHTSPFIEDAVQAMKQDGIEEAVSIVLTPHYSVLSVKEYHNRALTEADKLGGPILYTIDSWYKEPSFISYWVNQLNQVFSGIDKKEQEKAVVIFSAHSLPERILQMNDPYPNQVKETAKMIADHTGIKNYAVGWQSEGKSPEPWIGPDVKVLTKELYDKKQYSTFIYCPVGFIANHLEVLYDNDVECKNLTEQLGVNYIRPEMPNEHVEFIHALVQSVSKKIMEKAVI